MSSTVYFLSLIMFLFPNGVIENKAMELGNELICCVIEDREITSKHAVFIGEKLQSALKKYAQEFKIGYKIKCLKGDLKFPYGDGKAQYRIVIYSSKNEKLFTLRLKYDKKQKKFHILGFIISGKKQSV